MAPKLQNSRQVYHAMMEIVEYTDREHFIVICLDTKNKPIAINIATIGVLDSANIHPREIFKPAILCGASRIIVAHNHPSGESDPSVQDRKVTVQLLEAGKILGLPVLDHIIIGDDCYFSFKDSGLIDSSIQ